MTQKSGCTILFRYPLIAPHRGDRRGFTFRTPRLKKRGIKGLRLINKLNGSKIHL